MAGEILTQLNRIDNNIDAAFEKCRALGATMPSTINSDYLADTIETIPSSADIPVKTAADMTVSGATVTAPAGWYKQAASKSVPTATQATPSIEVNSSGLITAKTTQSAGYVPSGTKSATKQLTQQAAKTVTPTKSEQTAVAAGVYTTGAVKVAKIPDSYIQPTGTKSITANGTHDVKSFASVNVNVPTSGGGGGAVETCTVTFYETYGVGECYVYYMDGSLQPQMLFVDNKQIVMLKNSYFVTFGWGTSARTSSNIITIADQQALVLYKVIGDAEIGF